MNSKSSLTDYPAVSLMLDKIYRNTLTNDVEKTRILLDYVVDYSYYFIGLLDIEKESILGNRPLPESKLDNDDVNKIILLIREILSSQKLLNSNEYKKFIM